MNPVARDNHLRRFLASLHRGASLGNGNACKCAMPDRGCQLRHRHMQDSQQLGLTCVDCYARKHMLQNCDLFGKELHFGTGIQTIVLIALRAGSNAHAYLYINHRGVY